MLKKTAEEWRAIWQEKAARRTEVDNALSEREKARENLAFLAGIGDEGAKEQLRAFDEETGNLSRELQDLDSTIAGCMRFMRLEEGLVKIPEYQYAHDLLVYELNEFAPHLQEVDDAIQQLADAVKNVLAARSRLYSNAAGVGGKKLGELGFSPPGLEMHAIDYLFYVGQALAGAFLDRKIETAIFRFNPVRSTKGFALNMAQEIVKVEKVISNIHQHILYIKDQEAKANQ